MTQEALKLALDALKEAQINDDGMEKWDRNKKAITAIKEALAKEKALQALHDENERLGLYKDAYAQPEQEPVAWMHPDGRLWTFGKGFDKSTFTIPLYTTPPQRTWVVLSEQQRNNIEDACEMIIGKPAFDLIDAVLKENNT